MKKNLVLTGMMGVGKSTIGESLSVKLKMKFTDIDDLIKSSEGMSIQKIFQIKGEEYFRNIEKKITLKALEKNKTIGINDIEIIHSSKILEKSFFNNKTFWSFNVFKVYSTPSWS